jgi:CDP-diacylglycerol--serine O-phosphatidyltransferase
MGASDIVKKIAILPTFLTLGNAACGFAAIACASKIGLDDSWDYFALSGWLIMGAMLFDALDGYVARLSRTASRFGAELDSLCDGISFGAAPAFLLLRMGPGWEPNALLHQLLAGVATLYLICALLRLARFNVESVSDPAAHKRFRGLPSPGAAGCIASLALLRGGFGAKFIDGGLLPQLIQAWAMLGALLVALLMVSRVPYPHVTKQILRGRRHFTHLVQIILAGFILLLLLPVSLVFLFWLYAVGIPLRYSVMRSLRPGVRPAPAGIEDFPPR